MTTDAENLRIQQQINTVLVERSRMLDTQASRIADQVELALQLCKALKCEEVDRTVERLEEMRRSLDSVGKTAGETTNALLGGLKDANKEADKTKKATIDIDRAFKSLGSGIKGIFSKGLAGIAAFNEGLIAAGKFVSNLAIAIIGIPFKIFDILTEKAAELAANTEVFDAMERVREQFGDISEGFGKQVVDGLGSIKTAAAATGKSFSRFFGVGPGGVAAAIDASREMAVALGDAVNMLDDDYKNLAGTLVIAQMGLGLTGEDMKGLVIASRLAGKSATSLVSDLEKIAKDMSAKFGMSSKVIARDMAYMLQSTAKYGKLSAAQVAATVVYVKKLGLEVKQIEGLVAAFDDFETAATNASKLAQAFGMNVDALQMMKEQDPGKRLEMLRTSFATTGKSIDMMTRQEKQLLAQTAGLDEAIVEQALSAKNAGKSYQELSKDAEISAKKQKSQQEMFEDLGNAIKQMVEALNYSGGFITNFFTGFAEGLSRSQKGRAVLYDLASLLRGMRQLGREVGKVFVEAFPGVGKMFDGLHKVLSGKDGIGNIVKELRKTFQQFFADLKTNPGKAVNDLIDNLSGAFKGGAGATMMKDGLVEFVETVSLIIAGLIEKMGLLLETGLKDIASFLSNPSTYVPNAGGFASKIFAPILAAMKKALPGVLKALGDLILTAAVKFGPYLITAYSVILATQLGLALTTSIIKLAASAAWGLFVKGLENIMLKAIGSTAETPATSVITDAVEGIGGLVEAVNKLDMSKVSKAAGTLFAVAAGILVAMLGFMAGLVGIAYLIKKSGVTPTEIDSMMNVAAAAMAATLVATISAIALGAAAAGGAATGALEVGLAAAAAMLVAIGLFMVGFVALVGLVNGLGMKPPEVDAFTNLMTTAFTSVAKFAGIMMLAAVGMAALATIQASVAAFVAASIATTAMMGSGFVLAIVGMKLMDLILAAISEAIPTIVTYLSEIVESINKIPFDAEKLAFFFGTFAGIMLAVGTIATGSLMLGLTSLSPFANTLIEKGLEVMQKFMDMINDKIPQFIKSILAAVSGVNIEELKSKGEIAVKIIEAIASMMQPLSAAVELTKDPGFFSRMAGATGTNLSGVLTSLHMFMLNITDTASKFVYAIIEIVKDIPEDQLKKADTAIRIIETLSSLVSSLASSLSQTAATISTSGANPTEMHARMAAFKDLLKVNSDFMVDLAKPDGVLKKLIDSMISLASGIKLGKDARGNLDLLKGIVETINSITNSIIGIGTPEMREKITVASVQIPLIVSNLSNIVPHMLGFADVTNKYFGSGVNLKGANNLLAFMGKADDIAVAMGMIGSKTEAYSTAYTESIKDSISGAIDAMYELNEMLNDIHLKPIDVVVEDFAKKMITSKEVGIENKPINIHMIMNLTIDAEEFTKTVLTTTGKLVNQNNMSVGSLVNALANNQEIDSLERPR